MRLVGHLPPFVGREIDDRWVACPARLLDRAAERRAQPPPDRRNEQHQAQGVGDKPRNYKQNPPDYGPQTGTLEVNRVDTVFGEFGAKSIDVLAAGPLEDHEPEQRRGEKKANRPKPSDQECNDDECRDLPPPEAAKAQ